MNKTKGNGVKAFLFPGQGSQHMGMGRDIYDAFRCAQDVFQEVDETLGQNLTKIIFEGPEADLILTENAQPALMAVSMALIRVLEKEGGLELAQIARFVAGHSLAQYSALCAVGSLSLSDTARLLKIRGKAMQEAVPVGEGAMAALLGLEIAMVEKIVQEAAKGQVCEIANDNSPGQVVISGHREAVERAVELAKDYGAKRSIFLNVSAPFHCALMQPAQNRMAEALQDISIKDPLVPVVDNVSANAIHKGADFPALLIRQVTGRVRWRESIERLAEWGVTTTIEVGAGKVLTGLTKRIAPSLEAYALTTPHDIETFLKMHAAT
jgi:[acyl-carrier-protein] S-malonyltransferase